MKLFDAHCHLQDDALFPDLGNVLERAAAAGVERMVVCGTSPDDWAQVLQCPEAYCIGAHRTFQTSENLSVILPSIGIHPWFCSEHWKENFQCLEKMVRAYAAGENGAPMLSVGETGLNFQEKFTNRAEQEECFAAHLDLARELNRPVTVHCVQAWGRLIEILREHPAPKIVLHAFGGATELIPELIELNCWFSFCGNVTNPNAKKVRAAAVAVPAERLLIETDSPDFPPAGFLRRSSSYGGQGAPPNEPANLVHVARAVAELRGVSVEEIAELTFANASHVFRV